MSTIIHINKKRKTVLESAPSDDVSSLLSAQHALVNNVYILRRILSFVDDEKCRDSIYNVCRAWRANFRWVNPTVSYQKLVEHRNYAGVRQLWECCKRQIECTIDVLAATCWIGIPSHFRRVIANGDWSKRQLLTAIQCAAKGGDIMIFSQLYYCHNLDPMQCLVYGLGTASLRGFANIVSLLLQDKTVGASRYFDFALHVACYERYNCEIVAMLLADPRVDPTNDIFCIWKGCVKRNCWRQCPTHSLSALCVAVQREHSNLVNMLLADPRFHPQQTHDGNVRIDLSREERSLSYHTPIHEAIWGNHCDMLELLVSDHRVPSGFKSLYRLLCATVNGDANMLSRVLDSDVPLPPTSDITRVTLRSAFNMCVIRNDVAMVKRLLTVDWFYTDERQEFRKHEHELSWEPMMLAFCYGRSDIVDLLLADERMFSMMDVETLVETTFTVHKHRALDCLSGTTFPRYNDNSINKRRKVVGSHGLVIRSLMQFEPFSTAMERKKLYKWAGRSRYLAVFTSQLLTDPIVASSFEKSFWLRQAAANGDLITLELLLKNDHFDPAAMNQYALRWAARNGRTKVVGRLLQDERVEPSALDSGALRWAIENARVRTVRLLLSDGRSDPRARDCKSLLFAQRFVARERLLCSDETTKRLSRYNDIIQQLSGAMRTK